MAESWEFDPKTLEYTIHLRKGVKWHPVTLPSGKQLPATEFTAQGRQVHLRLHPQSKTSRLPSIEKLLRRPVAKRRIGEIQDQGDSFVRGDKYTVKVKWTKPYFAADEFTLGVPIIPRHVYSVDEKGDPISFDFSSKEFADGFNNHWANRAMCGTGPMIFKEWVKEQRVVLSEIPIIGESRFTFAASSIGTSRIRTRPFNRLLQNELDWSVIPEKDLFIQSQSHANVVAKKVVLDKLKYPQYRYLGYNMKRGILQG